MKIPFSCPSVVEENVPSLLNSSSLVYSTNFVSKKSHSLKSHTSICNCIWIQYNFLGLPVIVREIGFLISNIRPCLLECSDTIIPSGDAPI